MTAFVTDLTLKAAEDSSEIVTSFGVEVASSAASKDGKGAQLLPDTGLTVVEFT